MKINSYELCDSLVELKSFKNKSVDLIFTSLPDMSQTIYEDNKDVITYSVFQAKALEEFNRIIKDTGFIVISQTDRKANGFIVTNHVHYINELIKYGLKVKDEKVVFRNEFGKIDLYHMTFQYLTIFTRKGKFVRKGEILKDALIDRQIKCPPNSNQYCWSDNFCKMIIETLTKEGDLVVDPFAASGMVPFIAKKLNRSFWAGEIDPSMYNENFKYFSNRLE